MSAKFFWFLVFGVFVITLGVAAAAPSLTEYEVSTGPASYCEIVDPYPSELIDSSGLLMPRTGKIRFVARDGNELDAYTYRSSGWDGTGPILFGIHGASRGASRVRDYLSPFAERVDGMVIAPEFPKNLYRNFTTLVGDKRVRGGDYDAKKWREPDAYLYAEVEHLFEAVKILLDSPQCGYRIFGHSAGAQFTHRLVTFRSDARVIRAVAANAGWYTLPSKGEGGDPNFFFPYGLQGSPFTKNQLKDSFGKELVVLLGDQDLSLSSEDKLVRDTDEANAQGLYRLARGNFYFDLAQEEALALGAPLRWKRDIIHGVAHSSTGMIGVGAWYLFSPWDKVPCESTPASEATGLVINEILADPPKDEFNLTVGDANGDGLRVEKDDEFIELINQGEKPICLRGWTLGDNANPARHRFPLGDTLKPGEAVVVFGGGVPTGDFHGAWVQWTARGKLGLKGGGDGLTLADRAGKVHTRFTWGDCGDGACVDDSNCPKGAFCEHIEVNLSDNQSIVRSPEITGPWALHGEIEASGAPFSPGGSAQGSSFSP